MVCYFSHGRCCLLHSQNDNQHTIKFHESSNISCNNDFANSFSFRCHGVPPLDATFGRDTGHSFPKMMDSKLVNCSMMPIINWIITTFFQGVIWMRRRVIWRIWNVLWIQWNLNVIFWMKSSYWDIEVETRWCLLGSYHFESLGVLVAHHSSFSHEVCPISSFLGCRFRFQFSIRFPGVRVSAPPFGMGIGP